MQPTLHEFIPILLLAGAVLAFALGAVITPRLLGKRRSMNPVKDSPYECGLPAAAAPAGQRFGVKFHVVAMLFILFDIAVVFLAAWAWIFRDPATGVPAGRLLAAALVFIVIVEAAHLYAWRRGAFEWAPPRSGGRPTLPEEEP
jgi:NADH-quinone oxidoreductase subunit A